MRYFTSLLGIAVASSLFFVGQALGGAQHQSGQSQYGSSPSQMKTERAQQPQQHQQKTAAGQLHREQVRQLQKTLNQKGFAAGPADGVMGPKTREAIQSFQQSEGLAATGKADRETLRALDIQLEKEEFFGLSPEFGEKTMQQEQMQKQQEFQEMEQLQKQEMEREHQTPASEGMEK